MTLLYGKAFHGTPLLLLGYNANPLLRQHTKPFVFDHISVFKPHIPATWSLQCPIWMKCFFPLTWSSKLSSVISFPRKIPSAPVRIWYPSWELPQLPSTPVSTLITRRYNTHLLVSLLLHKILDDKNGLLCLNLHSLPGNFLLVQCLGLCTSMTKGVVLIPDWGT